MTPYLFVLCDWRTNSIRRAIFSNEVNIVAEWVLTWKIEVILYADFNEDVSVLVKMIKCFFSSFEGFVITEITMNIVAEIEEGMYTMDLIIGNKSFDSG